jgi:hypothetical protein
MTIAADGFLRLRGVKLPDAHNVSVDASVTTLEECGARCMANCSYVAYAPMDIRGGGGVGSGCIVWTVRMETVGKLLNHFLLLYLNTKTIAKTVKPDTKTNANLWNIENFENEPIRAKLCRTQLIYENSIRNIDPQCITINTCHRGKFQVQESRLINLVSFTREKKKKKEEKNLRCHRY